jgi:hypothetical protein
MRPPRRAAALREAFPERLLRAVNAEFALEADSGPESC